jgi:N-acetylmuramoyl-L-alanine amidase
MALAARLLRAFCFRSRVTPALLLACSFSLPLFARSAFDQAQHMRSDLEKLPPNQRTPLAYKEVTDAYRAIYHSNPNASKADASVLAVAQLLAEQGRIYADARLLHDAIGQYEYLNFHYPASRHKFEKQIAEGESQARQQLSELERPAKPAHRASGRNAVLAAAMESQDEARTPPAIQPTQVPAPTRPPPAMTPPAIQPDPSPSTIQTQPQLQQVVAPHPGRVAEVTGIRHWSTPVYTRIAIDLQDQVAYQAARVPSPDRIYFDLYGARLDSVLNGKSVEVIDDGFLKRIRAAQFSNNVTRIVLDVSSVSDYSAFLLPNPWRLIIDIHGLKPGTTATTNLASAAPPPAAAPAPAPAAPAPVAPPTTPVRHTAATQDIASLGQQPNRVQATAHPTTRPIVASVAGTTPAPQADDGSLASTTPVPGATRKKPSAAHPAPSSSTDADVEDLPERAPESASGAPRSLVRTLGLKIGRIVIDAGHGGHDSGTTGPGGIEEKDVVLDVSLRLGKLLKQRLGADVIYTRDNDTFIPLETRTAIANKAQADLFLSIHANSSPDPSARGVETYYLNFTTSPDALEVAARENAVSDESIHELSDLVKKITLKDKIDESREFAADVQKSLYDDLEEGNPGLRDRGVKKAPFVVLIGANMPSILAEISFLTNSDDARELRQPAYRQRIAESLYRGVAHYISGLSGVRLAQN